MTHSPVEASKPVKTRSGRILMPAHLEIGRVKALVNSALSISDYNYKEVDGSFVVEIGDENIVVSMEQLK